MYFIKVFLKLVCFLFFFVVYFHASATYTIKTKNFIFQFLVSKSGNSMVIMVLVEEIFLPFSCLFYKLIFYSQNVLYKFVHVLYSVSHSVSHSKNMKNCNNNLNNFDFSFFFGQINFCSKLENISLNHML